jgi:hypothetical protein
VIALAVAFIASILCGIVLGNILARALVPGASVIAGLLRLLIVVLVSCGIGGTLGFLLRVTLAQDQHR